MSDLTLTLLQQPLIWLDADANHARFAELITPLRGKTDLIILPEMFSTGFSMDPAPIAESMPGKTLDWLKTQAETANAAITGSFAVEEAGLFYNRLVFMQPDGHYQCYDKRHLFRMGNEHHRYQGGKERLVIDYRGWRICPMVCYDLRFPVWSRNGYRDGRNDFDLLIYVANWPKPRREHWLTLLKARAIENLCYVAGVNRLGSDGNNLEYTGDSTLFDAWGDSLISASPEADCFTQRLSGQALRKIRKQFPAHLDADVFELKMELH